MNLTCEVTNQNTVDTIALMIETLTGGAYKVVSNKVIEADDKSADSVVGTNPVLQVEESCQVSTNTNTQAA